MELARFLDKLDGCWETDPQTADYPKDRRFRSVIETTGGMATENKLALLNLAATCLSPDEIYLEIGAYRGTSIIGAAMGNEGQQFVTVDDFSQFAGTRREFQDNVERSGCSNITLIESDFVDLLANGAPFAAPVGVYFYDGRHRYRDQWAALRLIEPRLSDTALVIIDDTGFPGVAEADKRFTARRPQFQLLRRFESERNGEPRWWNGIEIYAYRRTEVGAPSSDRLRYLVGAARYGAPSELMTKKVIPRLRRLRGRLSRG